MTGIRRPKMSHHFMVVYRATMKMGTGITEDIAAGLEALSAQTVTFKLPTIALLEPAVGFHVNSAGMQRVTAVGQCTLDIEDDINSVVLKTLLALRAAEELSIIVMKTDGNDCVLDAYELRDVKLRAIEHSELRYDAGIMSARGTLTGPSDEQGNTLSSNVNLTLNTNTFGSGVVGFRVKGDVNSMLVCTRSGLTVQDFLELV